MIFPTARKPAELPDRASALPGRDRPLATAQTHHLTGAPLKGPYRQGHEKALFGMGCFWGAEKCFWSMDGVLVTAVGYAAGLTPNPTYEEVCTGMTGHNEVVLVVFDPAVIAYDTLLKIFWENHDPTQGMRQGNDTGTQYRSGIYTFGDAQDSAARASLARFQLALDQNRFGPITTEIAPAGTFYFAEAGHQQ